MIIYNLTDRTPPWEKVPRTPNKLKIRGVTILPGRSHEFDDFSLAQVAGHINAHRASVDGIPPWYQKAEISEKEKRFKAHFEQVTKIEKEKAAKAAKEKSARAGDASEEDDDEAGTAPKRRKKKGGGKK